MREELLKFPPFLGKHPFWVYQVASSSIRGWVFTPQVDDQESECGLDRFFELKLSKISLSSPFFRVSDWDLVIQNNGGSVDEWLDKLEQMAKYQQ